MYKISGIKKERWYLGQLLRQQVLFEEHLQTERGVKAYLEEQAPFLDLKIVDEIANEDVTAQFVLGESSEG